MASNVQAFPGEGPTLGRTLNSQSRSHTRSPKEGNGGIEVGVARMTGDRGEGRSVTREGVCLRD